MHKTNQRLSTELQNFLGIQLPQGEFDYEIIDTKQEDLYDRHLIHYPGNEKDVIPAYLFIPRKHRIIGSILVHHQHHGERHLGKSEVAGISGDPFQFFCPEFAKKGVITLAPDSICFEDRRSNKKGFSPDDDPDQDMLQHYNQMCYRILNGSHLMKKVVEDSMIGISLLSQLEENSSRNIGLLGHSYGGNTVIFHFPFDERVQYACSSGAVCSYRNKFHQHTGIEMAEVIPGFTTRYDIEDLFKSICSGYLLVISSDQDKFSRDAGEICQTVNASFVENGIKKPLIHKRFRGEHALDQERFDFIINWFVNNFKDKV